MSNVDPTTAHTVCNATTFRAVQLDTAATCVVWQVFHGWREGDPNFSGAVTVVDQHGAQCGVNTWPAPTDACADTAVRGMGWQRTGPWTHTVCNATTFRAVQLDTAATCVDWQVFHG